MKRPLLTAAASLLSTALLVVASSTAAQTKTLRFVPHADLKILDPSFTTAYITRNFGDFEFRKFRLYLWGATYEFLSRSLDCYRTILYKPKEAA